ncbi:hypothetical protein ACQKKX_04525 [Neorhizobium sp. NPDC001467]|uniref:hypothetical protein n=1 Tax=Neorhizobium sp. NPDC001467 TaxID=3390595 RepID=UPI003D090E6B
MPVILELEEYEADLVVAALMEGRIRLMKEWGERWRSPDRSPFEDDLAHNDADIVAVAEIRERLKEGIMWQRFCQERSADPEKRVSVAWHHEHGWLPSADFIEKPMSALSIRIRCRPAPGLRCLRMPRTGCSTSRIPRTRSSSLPPTAAFTSREHVTAEFGYDVEEIDLQNAKGAARAGASRTVHRLRRCR